MEPATIPGRFNLRTRRSEATSGRPQAVRPPNGATACAERTTAMVCAGQEKGQALGDARISGRTEDLKEAKRRRSEPLSPWRSGCDRRLPTHGVRRLQGDRANGRGRVTIHRARNLREPQQERTLVKSLSRHTRYTRRRRMARVERDLTDEHQQVQHRGQQLAASQGDNALRGRAQLPAALSITPSGADSWSSPCLRDGSPNGRCSPCGCSRCSTGAASRCPSATTDRGSTGRRRLPSPSP